MRSLFLKIFLWFWAAQICIAAALYGFAATTQRGLDQRLAALVGDGLQARAKAAAIAYELGGVTAVREAWQLPGGGYRSREGEPPQPPPEDTAPADGPPQHGRAERPPGGPPGRGAAFYVLRGSKVLQPVRLAGPSQPTLFDSVTPRTFVDGEAVAVGPHGLAWVARRIDTPRGSYMAVAPLRQGMGRPGGFWGSLFQSGPDSGPWRLVVAALTMGLVCYALARYLADPAIKLRRATYEFAAGNLDIRVGPAMGSRRDELADLGRDFDLMAERIQSLRVAERRLLGDISHELRSPLARLQVTLDLAEPLADATMRDYLGRIAEEATELKTMIDQLLTLTRLENAGSEVPMSDCIDLQQLVEEVCADADFEAASRDGHVRVLRTAQLAAVGNRGLLYSAVENVVRNAVFHSPERPEVEVALFAEGSSAIITVRDHGPGVPEAALTEMFRPFYRVAEARDRQSGGVGLGLSITQRAVLLHGGEVVARNEVGGGLCVTIRVAHT